MLDDQLDDLSCQRARSTGIDWRNAWAGLSGDGRVVAWPSDAARALSVEELVPRQQLVLGTVLEPMRRHPRHAAEMISEVRAGERLTGLLKRDRWWLVAGEDSYVGWVHDWVLAEAGPEDPPPAFRYARPLGTLWLSDHHAATPLWRGMPLWRSGELLHERGTSQLVRTPTGAEGWIDQTELAPAFALAAPRELLNLLRGLAGTPYRWGGRSPLGFDCSGFVQYAAQLCGADLPRDAGQQAGCGEPVDREAAPWHAGDLLFFGDPVDHVGFSDGRGQIIHCQGRVRIDPLQRRPDLAERLVAVRRWWPMRGFGPARAWTAMLESG